MKIILSFIGEESTSEKLNFSNDPVWIIDPIDGTTNFVHRYPYCAISIALAINKEVTKHKLHLISDCFQIAE